MIKCKICKEQTNQSEIKVRSGKVLKVNHCQNCDFDFFDFDPTQLLSEDKLDDSRLKSAGLDIPSIEKDFENGLKQSLPYIDEFISENDKGANVLEIGCSVGYFLSLLKKNGINPYGIELNLNRSKYVNETLEIPCFNTLESCINSNLKFKKIFLFYVIEYINNPIDYFNKLLELLDDGGSIIIVSPNLKDFLKDVWQNIGFKDFFYDECAVNYFSYKSLDNFAKNINVNQYNLYTRQGYSFVNHLSWYLTNKPRTTGIVGGDKFIDDLVDIFNSSSFKFKNDFVNLLHDFDLNYKKLIEKSNYGNQLYLILNK